MFVGLGLEKCTCVSGLLPWPMCSVCVVIDAGPPGGTAASVQSVPHRIPSTTAVCRADVVAPGNAETVEAGSTLNRLG